ncbi:hypothetical protein PtrEW7m1_001707 [Pyrenophora tritici-repentis]|nr:hypothetical protein Alg215_02401 [Pyrenophora tritici-repentis]KAI1586249.1 hypothetical protein PtrEW7m1_001707 [Pyrenophora tritici-repentis]
MGLFRRSVSAYSSASSHSSTIDSASEPTSSRTSMDSTYEREVSDSLATITKLQPIPAPAAPILSLPIELIRHVNTYLDTATAASFCLSSRYIYYALGTNVLTRHIDGSKNRFEKRRVIEEVVERAFPGHWFCAWCDKFHAWDASESPNHAEPSPPQSPRWTKTTTTTPSPPKQRECLDYNSYLTGSPTYTLRYHHIRLALNAHLHGPSHGIPLSTFSHDHKTMARISKTPVPTTLRIRARISQTNNFLLHTSFAIILPSFTTHSKHLLKHLWPLFPHALTGHRDTDCGHAGLMAAVDNVVRRGWKYAFTQSCEVCGADWAVSRQDFVHQTGGQVRLVVQSWRDLGKGRSPFERAWRGHGVAAEGMGGGEVQVAFLGLGVAGGRAGAVREMFEQAGEEGVANGSEKKVDARPSRLHRTFSRSQRADDSDIEVRRSSARPRYWRTREENEEDIYDFPAFVQNYKKVKSDYELEVAKTAKLHYDNAELQSQIAQIKAGGNPIQQTNDSDYDELQRHCTYLEAQIADTEVESQAATELARSKQKEHDELKKKLEDVIDCNKKLVQRDLAWSNECKRVSHFAHFWEGEAKMVAQRFENYKNRVKALGEERQSWLNGTMYTGTLESN